MKDRGGREDDREQRRVDPQGGKADIVDQISAGQVKYITDAAVVLSLAPFGIMTQLSGPCDY